MLVVHETARERFEAAKEHARKVGLTCQFARQLNYLRTYGEHDEPARGPQVRVTLGCDFAPHSFTVTWEIRTDEDRWENWFVGGLIFHGPHTGGVVLTPAHGWSVHT